MASSSFERDSRNSFQHDSRSSKESDIYSLKMNSDRKTEMYVKFAKVMIIFQGPVTEKRLSAVSKLASKFKHSVRVISDDTYKSETCKFFEPENTEFFYEYFKSRVKKACEDGFNLIVIEQSLSNTDQIRYYLFLAQAFQYVILPIPTLVIDKISSSSTDERKSGIKANKPIENQARSFERTDRHRLEYRNLFRHLYSGWFLHDVDSREMREEASLYVQDCFEIPEFEEMLIKTCKRSEIKSCYNLDNRKQDLACCIVKIFSGDTDVIDYISDEYFKKYYGAMTKLYIVGFIVSPHIIAARVRLSFEQKKLWKLQDDLEEKYVPTVYPSELLKGTKVSMPKETVTLLSSKCNRTIISGKPIDDPTNSIPHNSRGRSCHIVLGTVKNAPARNINYDVPYAVCRERTVVPKYSDDVKPYDLPRSMVRRIGKYLFIYLKETIVVDGFFATCCSAESYTR